MTKKSTKTIDSVESNTDVKINTGDTISVKETSIFDTYRKYINQANGNYLTNINYSDVMTILRYVEKRIGNNLALNMSCPACLINLIQMFSRLENK